jgi:TonB family protein
MKKCPSCDRTYPDKETFCEADGVALIKAGPAFVESGAPTGGEAIECPVCGGRAEPGEVICNFCGARLTSDAETAASPAPQPSAAQRPGQSRTMVSSAAPERFSGRLTGQMPESEPDGEGRGSFTVLGYVAAALVALVGGAWLALHLSSRGPAQEAATASPAAAVTPGPASPAGPLVALANTVPVQVTGESSSAVERSADAMRKVFDDGKGALLDAYKRALGGDATTNDGMIVRVRIMPDGSVAGAAVRTSTAPNPSLDAEVIKAVSGWSYVPFTGGQVEVDYPIIFARDATEQASIESALATRVASLGTDEAPEYGSSVAASPEASSSPAAAAVPSESVAPAAAATPPARAHPRHLARVPRAAPTPSFRDRISGALRSNRNLGRVQFYTNPGGSVVLFGKVFDEKSKGLAVQVVRGVPGVTAVVDNLTTDTDTWRQQQAQVQSQLANAGLGSVNVRIIGRDAFLSGEVTTDAEKDRAVTITEGAAPVIVRTNLITVKPGSVFGF